MTLNMPDEPPNTRRCTGSCGQQLPETEEFFYLSPAGKFAPCCRECHNLARRNRVSRRRGPDALRGHIEETKRVIGHAFRKSDPDGSRSNDLVDRFRSIIVRFRELDYEKKAAALSQFIKDFLRPPEVKS